MNEFYIFIPYVYLNTEVTFLINRNSISLSNIQSMAELFDQTLPAYFTNHINKKIS